MFAAQNGPSITRNQVFGRKMSYSWEVHYILLPNTWFLSVIYLYTFDYCMWVGKNMF